jgi:hypothetical protein
MQPNRYRIPGDQDPAAKTILDRVPEQIDLRFLDSLNRDALPWLGRYGARQVTTALQEHSADLLHQALLATALATCLTGDNWDDRDLMVTIALHWVVAQRLGVDPAAMFARVAGRIPNPEIAEVLTVFGARDDITLKAFGWEEVTTNHGPDFRPAPYAPTPRPPSTPSTRPTQQRR